MSVEVSPWEPKIAWAHSSAHSRFSLKRSWSSPCQI